MQGWERFQERAQWNALWHNHPTSPENAQNMTKPVTTKHKHMLLAEKKVEEIERKNARLGTLPGESPVECHSVRFPPSLKLLSWVFDMLGTPGNKKGSWHNHPTSPENAQNMTKPVTTKHTHMLLAEKKMEEIERRNARLGTLPGESPVECQVHQVVEPNPPLQLEMVREPNGYCSQPDEFDSRNHLCSQGLQRCRQYIYQVARCCYQCFHQKLFRNNCLAFDPSLDSYFHGVWPR